MRRRNPLHYFLRKLDMELKLQPYQLATVRDPARWYNEAFVGELMSFKTPENTIMVRTVPGHPGTLIEVHIDCIKNVRTLDKNNSWFVHYAIVAGGRNANFPVDMLRYDQCVPVNFKIFYNGERHVAAVDQPENSLVGQNGDLLVAQVSQKRYEPFTVARWSSFLWGCKHIVTEEYPSGFRINPRAL